MKLHQLQATTRSTAGIVGAPAAVEHQPSATRLPPISRYRRPATHHCQSAAEFSNTAIASLAHPPCGKGPPATHSPTAHKAHGVRRGPGRGAQIRRPRSSEPGPCRSWRKAPTARQGPASAARRRGPAGPMEASISCLPKQNRLAKRFPLFAQDRDQVVNDMKKGR